MLIGEPSPRRTGVVQEIAYYLPAARRCQRVAFNSFLCFFLRIRLRRFFMREPMVCGTLAGKRAKCQVGEWFAGALRTGS